MTLIEVLVSTGLVVGGGGAMLVGMHYNGLHVDYLREQQVAMNAAQGKLDEIVATVSFNKLIDPGPEGWLSSPSTPNRARCASMGEDDDCNGLLNDGILNPLNADTGLSEDVNGNGVLDPPLLTNGRFAIQVKPPSASVQRDLDPTKLTAVRVHVAARWRFRGRCISIEDRNCNGVVNAGEDANGNGWIDAPVMVSTIVTRRDNN